MMVFGGGRTAVQGWTSKVRVKKLRAVGSFATR